VFSKLTLPNDDDPADLVDRLLAAFVET